MDRNEQTNSEQLATTYEPPKVLRVSLRPEEAVLGHCKISGSAGAVASSCTTLVCRTIGS